MQNPRLYLLSVKSLDQPTSATNNMTQTVELTPQKSAVARKRRAHTKSRRGCANCKLRSVKCDESKPKCQKCISFGVACLYGPKCSAESLSIEGSSSFRVNVSPGSLSKSNYPRQPQVPRSPPLTLPWYGPIEINSRSYRLLPVDVPVLDRFSKRTLHTIGPTAHRPLYTAYAVPIGFMHPFVMHLILSLTLLHDTALDPVPPNRPSSALEHHWSRAVTLFSDKLTWTPRDPRLLSNNEKDALWVAAGFMGIAAFAGVNPIADSSSLPSATAANCGSNPAATDDVLERVWPLRPSSPMDLSWLKLNSGKKQVWELAHPTRMNGLFREAAMNIWEQFQIRGCGVPFADSKMVSSLPMAFDEAFDLSKMPNESNPYYGAVTALAEIYPLDLEADSDDEVMPLVHKFVAIMEPQFKDLLEAKDDRALLLLAYWYAKVCHRRLWWLWRRAWLEGLATCRLLERRWANAGENVLKQLLVWPKMMIQASI